MTKTLIFGFAAGLFMVFCPAMPRSAEQTDVKTVIEQSIVANDADFKAAPDFNYKETDRTPHDSKTYQVTMVEGSPYQRLIAINGRPLSPTQRAEEQKKQEQVTAQRRSESLQERQKRISKYEKDRTRDHEMMAQLTRAFNFQLMGKRRVRSFTTYVLRAVPRPDYNPPNMETQVLKGMQGELWVDQKTYQWVKVTAEVIHPVSIEGFLAQVEPGTRFEVEKPPVSNAIWQITHFSIRSRAKVLFMVNRSSQEDETYFDYQPVSKSVEKVAASPARWQGNGLRDDPRADRSELEGFALRRCRMTMRKTRPCAISEKDRKRYL